MLINWVSKSSTYDISKLNFKTTPLKSLLLELTHRWSLCFGDDNLNMPTRNERNSVGYYKVQTTSFKRKININ